ncbi:MAG TPA: methyltransferase domain-containing protein [Gaiellales bacterium]
MHDQDATSAADEYRRRSAQNWETAAAGWEAERDRMRVMSRPLTAWLVANLDLRPGVTVLEVAAGPGETGLEVAAALTGSGKVILSDRSPAMVEVARRAAAAAGLENVQLRVLDAESMELADAVVDRVVCRFGYMLLPDPAAALRETRRVLRADGRLAFAVWGAAAENEWATTLWDILERLTDLPPAQPGGPGMFALGDPDRLRRLVAEAGFEVRAVEPIAVEWTYAGFDDYWHAQTSLNGGLTRLMPTLTTDERDALMSAVREAIERFRDGDGYRLAGVTLGVAADAM